ncbi:MAG: hypothetical protein K2H38_12120 [Muribaculaceae bacterium]|nr:hypothetical protein [Muribaculaceae bacterium]
MMQFIETVTLYSINTAKARPIQAAASQFEHMLLEESALASLCSNLKLIVDICNRSYRGNPLEFRHEPGHISVRYPASGTEKVVVSISYAPVLSHITHRFQIREEIQRRLERECPEFCARYIVEYTKKGGEL